MKFMKRRGLRLFAVAALLPGMAAGAVTRNANAATSSMTMSAEDSAAVQQVTQRVRDFLASVPKNDPKVFEDFFADDVIYTRSTGVTVTKADILKNIGVRASNEPQATYDSDDFTVHVYGNMAVVNFRLIKRDAAPGAGAANNYYRNTGTFLKRNGKWQAVAWQATMVPEEAKAKP